MPTLFIALALTLSNTQASGAPRETPDGLAGKPLSIDALDAADLVVVGRVKAVRNLDEHGRTAPVVVEASLGSQIEAEVGQLIHIAWEELAVSRPPRLTDGDRVLLCLVSVPTASLWRERFPTADARRDTYVVSSKSECFLRDPSAPSIDFVVRYLTLPSVDRATEPGIALLMPALALGDPRLALGAALRLASANELPEADLGLLVRALERGDADGALAKALLDLTTKFAGDPLAKALADATAFPLHAQVADLERRPSPLAPPRLFEALARARGGLPSRARATLLARPEVAYRLVVARHAASRDLLRELLADDPAPTVRAAALQRLVETEREAALSFALQALGDPARLVRNTAARAASTLGPPGVRGLRDVVFGQTDAREPAKSPRGDRSLEIPVSPEAQYAALGGLGAAGRAGRVVLLEVAQTHSSESLRQLATLALGYTTRDH